MRLRGATSAHDKFCFRLNEAAKREYFEPIYGLDADVQRTRHAESFEPERLSIIEDDGAPVGVLDVRDEGDHLYLGRIAILPEAQGRGLGTAVVRDLLSTGRTVRLHVFANNVSARRFYEGLGFEIDHHADREFRVSMHDAGEAGSPSRTYSGSTKR
jgi:ribosomal protein S18 acetylase RimI-like enzyme